MEDRQSATSPRVGHADGYRYSCRRWSVSRGPRQWRSPCWLLLENEEKSERWCVFLLRKEESFHPSPSLSTILKPPISKWICTRVISQTRAASKFPLPEYLERQSLLIEIASHGISLSFRWIFRAIDTWSSFQWLTFQETSAATPLSVFTKRRQERDGHINGFKVYSETRRAWSTDLESTVTA